MMDTIARTGSFAAAARELGKVPSALTYSVRQLEEALDVLLFDRSSRQAQLTAAGSELLHEGRRLLQEMDAVANRVRRVASGWETQLTISVDDVMSRADGVRAGARPSALCAQGPTADETTRPGTRLRLRSEVLAGTWEALVSGQADLAIGVGAGDERRRRRHRAEAAGRSALRLLRGAAPPAGRTQGPLSDAQLLHHRAVAVADSAQRLSPITVNLLPGQDVLTVAACAPRSRRCCAAWAAASCPSRWRARMVDAGRLVQSRPRRAARRWRGCTMPGAPSVARWAAGAGAAVVAAPAGRQPGHARALLERHAACCREPAATGGRFAPSPTGPLHAGSLVRRAGQLAGRARARRPLAGAHRGRRHAALRAGGPR
jgi:DNA-binding transcriptional LysR family regulator